MKHTIIDQPSMDDNRTKLTVIHSSGFFSCCTIGLMDIVIYFNLNKSLPDIVDRFQQYNLYKTLSTDNIISFYFKEHDTRIGFNEPVNIAPEGTEVQYADYSKIDFGAIAPFIYKFFTPSYHVLDILAHYEWKYQLDYENTCAIFYRGNDKNRETKIAPYDQFISKAIAIQVANPNIKFLVQPDETEFLEACKLNLGEENCIVFDETPHMRKKDSAMFLELPQAERAEYGAKYFAAVLALSRCKHLITHSGNGGLWSVIYRGNADNIHQWIIDKWV